MTGWLSVTAYLSGREALDEVAETSYYVDNTYHGKEIGTALMEYTLSFFKNAGYRILISDNSTSITLLNKFGFKLMDTIPDAIHLGNQYYNHFYLGLKI